MTTTPSDHRTRTLRQAMAEIVDAGFLGVAVRVHDERGEWTGSAGAAELGGTAKPPLDGHFRIGSATKTFIAALVLNLVAEGKLALDTPAAALLPAPGPDERITVRMLLQHTSGIFNFTGEVRDDGTLAPGIPMPYGPGGGAWLADRFRTHRPEELAALALAEPLKFEPGTAWSYSNTNYVLARLLIEHVTGRPLAAEAQRVLLGPLGLSGTVVPDASPDLPGPHARAYYRHDGEVTDITRQNPSWISSGGDLISTTRDLHTFFAALLRGDLLPDDLLAELRRPHPTGIPDTAYGLGVFVLDTPGGTVLSHNGAAAGQAALMCATPDGRTTLTAVLNGVDDAALSLGAAFRIAQDRLVAAVFHGKLGG